MWQRFSAKRTEADYQDWRDQRDWTTEKYRRFDRGEWTAHDRNATPGYSGQPMTDKPIELWIDVPPETKRAIERAAADHLRCFLIGGCA